MKHRPENQQPVAKITPQRPSSVQAMFGAAVMAVSAYALTTATGLEAQFAAFVFNALGALALALYAYSRGQFNRHGPGRIPQPGRGSRPSD